MRISQDKLLPAIDLGRAVPDTQICKPRAKGELRVPPDKVRREVVAALQACSSPGGKGRGHALRAGRDRARAVVE